MAETVVDAASWTDDGLADAFTGAAGALGSSDDVRVLAINGVAPFHARLKAVFANPALPAGSTILGLELRIEARGGISSRIKEAWLSADGIDSAHKSPLLPLTSSDTVFLFGGDDDQWGYAPPSAADLNAEAACYIECDGFVPGDFAEIDHVALAITHGAKRFYYPASTWVFKVCFYPGEGVQVTFKDSTGRPYFTCLYPGSTETDYDLFSVMASQGRWVHAAYFFRPYVPRPLEV